MASASRTLYSHDGNCARGKQSRFSSGSSYLPSAISLAYSLGRNVGCQSQWLLLLIKKFSTVGTSPGDASMPHRRHRYYCNIMGPLQSSHVTLTHSYCKLSLSMFVLNCNVFDSSSYYSLRCVVVMQLSEIAGSHLVIPSRHI